jgi:predicted ATPase
MTSAKVVITGGEYCGKTALVEALAEHENISVRPESAMIVIGRELANHASPTAFAKWRLSSMKEFQDLVAIEQLEQEAVASTDRIVVYDRGLLDGFAYCQLADSPVPLRLWTGAQLSTYNAVFILDTITPFVTRHETGRSGTLQESERTRDLLEDIYKAFRVLVYRVKLFDGTVPESIRQRMDFVLTKLRDMGVLLREGT